MHFALKPYSAEVYRCSSKLSAIRPDMVKHGGTALLCPDWVPVGVGFTTVRIFCRSSFQRMERMDSMLVGTECLDLVSSS